MNNSATRTWTFTCPHCGQTNTLIFNELPEDARIDCWKCHDPLGFWRDMKTEPNPQPASE